MNFTDIFIKKPVLAIVVSLLILLAGFQSMSNMTVRQYPRSDIAVIRITTAYIGANADLVRGLNDKAGADLWAFVDFNVAKVGTDEITSAIQALPVDFRMIIILCDLEEFSYEEMAKILNIPIGTVRSRLHRARTLLKETLASYAAKKGYKTDMLSA